MPADGSPDRPTDCRARRRRPNKLIRFAVVGGVLVGASGLVAADQIAGHPAGATVPAAAPAEHLGESTVAFVAPVLPRHGAVQPVGVRTPRHRTPHHRQPQPAQSVSASTLAANGIPSVALQAYRQAAAHERVVNRACGLTWPLLAGIGRVESDHGRFAGAVLHTNGVSTPRIIGIPLDGSSSARILDTDDGRLDGDKTYDRAVGPMQFIPSTWALFGTDGDHDGKADPFDIFDAARAAAHYLCTAGGDLTTLKGQGRAVLAYNHSEEYLALVLRLEAIYARGVPGLSVPVLPAHSTVRVTPRRDLPPVNPGRPLATGRTSTTAPAVPGTPSGSTPTATAPASPSASPTATTTAPPPTVPAETAAPTGTQPTAPPTAPADTAAPTGPLPSDPAAPATGALPSDTGAPTTSPSAVQ